MHVRIDEVRHRTSWFPSYNGNIKGPHDNERNNGNIWSISSGTHKREVSRCCRKMAPVALAPQTFTV